MTLTQIIASLSALVIALTTALANLKLKQNQTAPPSTPPSPTPSTLGDDRIYAVAKAALGTKQTLNQTIPAEVGCGEAWSSVVKTAGVQGIPATGLPGTATIYEWLVTNPAFEQIYNPEAGATIIFPTGYGNGSIEGHIGIIAAYGVQYPGDWGVCSNSSASGLWSEHWSIKTMGQYYTGVGGIPQYMFRWKG